MTLRFAKLRAATLRGMALLLAAAALATVRPASGAPSDPKQLQLECEYGIALALEGKVTEAEAAFMSLLSHSPRDPRALNNLGNTHLLRGDLDVALAYYQRAQGADPQDAGIVLNRATAFLIHGDEDQAVDMAADGVRRAGSARNAAKLLGLALRDPADETARGADKTYLSREEVIALIQAAAAEVSQDTTLVKRKAPPAPGGKKRRRVSPWRAAGTRGSDGTDTSTVLYWKQ